MYVAYMNCRLELKYFAVSTRLKLVGWANTTKNGALIELGNIELLRIIYITNNSCIQIKYFLYTLDFYTYTCHVTENPVT